MVQKRSAYGCLVGKPKKGDLLENIGADVMILLNWTLKK
jgi:hypothetical protein